MEFALLEPLPAQLERLLAVSGMTGRLPSRPAAVAPTPADPPAEGVGASDD